MGGMDSALDVYNITAFYRYLYMYCCCCCYKKRKQAIRDTYFFQSWLKVSKACLPDEIQWQNIGYSGSSRRMRKALIWILALALVVLGVYGVIWMK